MGFNVPDDYHLHFHYCPNGTRYHAEDGGCYCSSCDRDEAVSIINFYENKALEIATQVMETAQMPYEYHNYTFHTQCRRISEAPLERREDVLKEIKAEWVEMIEEANEILKG